MDKHTLIELTDTVDTWDEAVIVFSQDSFTRPYSQHQRSYAVKSDNKYFNPDMIGKSLYGNCLDGTDNGVRLDWYLGTWKVEFCYITKHKEVQDK